MNGNTRIPHGVGENGERLDGSGTPEEKLRNLRNVLNSVTREALTIWAEIWDQFQGSVAEGVAVLPQAQKGWEPECGWPEFLEKMWILRSKLDYARRISDPKP